MTIRIFLAGAAIAMVAGAVAFAQTPSAQPAPGSGSGTHSRSGAVTQPARTPATSAARPAARATTPAARPAAATAPAPVRDARLALAIPDAKGYHRVVLLRALDKITGRAIDVVAPAGRPVQFATLQITARYCHKVPPSEPPESSAFLQIRELKPNEPPVTVFSGWMFASSPSINALEHAVYDVWITACITDEPEPPPPAPPVVARAHRPTVSGGGNTGAPVTVTPPNEGEPSAPSAAPQPEPDEPVDDQVGTGNLPSQ